MPVNLALSIPRVNKYIDKLYFGNAQMTTWEGLTLNGVSAPRELECTLSLMRYFMQKDDVFGILRLSVWLTTLEPAWTIRDKVDI